MRKKIILLLLLAGLINTSVAQSPSWVTTLGGGSVDEGSDIVTDGFGNVYSCGRFSGTVDFDNGPGTFNLISNGNMDIYVTKYSPNGQFLWAIGMGGTDRDGAVALKTNSANEIIVTGYIRNTVDMDPGPGTYNLYGVSNSGVDPGFGGDLFLAKYSTTGNFIWAFSVENEYWQNSGWGLAVDDADNIYLAASNNATSGISSDFDPGPGVAILSGIPNGHGILAKYTNAGAYVWAFAVGEWGQNSSFTGVELVPNDTTLIVTGHVKGANFDANPGPGVNNLSTQQEDVFAARYSTNGAYIWAFNCGSTSVDVTRHNDVDSNGNFYMTGIFSNTIDLDPGPGTSTFVSNGNFDAFIAKYDLSGNYLWAKSFGSSGLDHGWDITRSLGVVTAIGHFSNTADFDPGAATFNLTSAGSTDAFITRFDTAGNFICAVRIGGPQDELLWRIYTLTNDTIIVNGHYGSNNIDVDPTPNTLLHTNSGGNDIIFGKYFYQNTPVNYTATVINDTVCAGQNPTITVDISPNLAGLFTATITDGINVYITNNVSDSIPFSFLATPLVQTNYTVTITGQQVSGCSAIPISISSPFTIFVYPQPLVTAFAAPASVCPGEQVILTGGGASLYSWTGGVTNGVGFVPIATSTYTVTGTDINGCTNTSAVTVNVNLAPNVTANASPPSVCVGFPVTLTGSGASTYIWTGGVADGVPFVPTTTTTYTVTGTDANGCTNISTVTVTVNANIPITVVPNTPILCLGDSVQLTASGASNYNWSNVPGLNTYSGPTVWAQPTVGTTYTVTGTDANGCTGTASVFITVANEIYVEATKSADIECNNHSIQLHASGAANYSWTPTNLLNNANVADPYASVYETTTFYVTGTLGSCVASDSITVYAYNNDEGSIFIPNAFSPNGDNLNDCLKVKENAKFQKFYFTIYNRWGQRVFEADNPDMCWDGMLNGHPSEVGVYFYYLQAETNCGKIFKKGDITLLR